jgi:long-chain acyl-CoA synthetase
MIDADAGHGRSWAEARTLTQSLLQRAAETPKAVAFRVETGPQHWDAVSWKDFVESVDTIRRGLATAGLRRGDRLALIAPGTIDWELVHHAALSLGAAVVGMDGHDLPLRIAYMSRQAGITAFAVADPGVLAALTDDDLGRVRFLLDLAPPQKTARWPAGPPQLRLDDVRRLATQPSAMGAADPAQPEPGDLATIIFTSGTTGAPKGIPYTHEQICLAVAAICGVFDFVRPESHLLCWLPLSNLFQRVVNLSAVRQGVATWLLDDPRRVMAVVADVAPDVFIGVPRFYEKLLEGIRAKVAAQPPWKRALVAWAWETGRRASRRQRQGLPLPAPLALAHRLADRLVLAPIRSVMGHRLRCMVTGSAPTSPLLLEELHALGWPILEAYGLSENAVPIAMNRLADFRFGTVGKPVPGNDVRIGDGGAVQVRGAGVFRGYVGAGAATALDADGYYTTGDLGAFDDAGYLRLTGRDSEMIKTSTGRRVSPAAIEARLQQLPGIDQAVLIGNGRKCLVALCSAPEAADDPLFRARLAAALPAALASIGEQDRPRAVGLIARAFAIDLEELTPNLKLRRAAIEKRHAALIDALYATIDRTPPPPPSVVVV